MTKSVKCALHIFRRDLRLEDNSALLKALHDADTVIPCFIFDKRQIDDNPYKSEHAIQFMVNSLTELDQALREKNSQLYCFYGIAEEVIEQLIAKLKIDAIYVNRDYTPFARMRDQLIEKLCKTANVGFYSCADTLLHEPESIHKANGTPYTVYTAFYNQAKQHSVSKPLRNTHTNYYQQAIPFANPSILKQMHQKQTHSLAVSGGRLEAKKLTKRLTDLTNYHEERNFPALQKTSHLSAHLKFGTISIRELHYVITTGLGASHTLIRELYWRDFFTHIAFHFPRVFGHAFHEKYDKIHWQNNPAHFKAWRDGRTGFPIVDAGMRELNQTGNMHNRVRMIVASFLVKDLHIDWQQGERYFAQQLIDYDPAVNNGNWQWAASTGCDAQPYFRIFNPWLQQKKFDADCIYIKQWIPELTHLSAKEIHALATQPITNGDYPHPIVDHQSASRQAKILYSRSSNQ